MLVNIILSAEEEAILHPVSWDNSHYFLFPNKSQEVIMHFDKMHQRVLIMGFSYINVACKVIMNRLSINLDSTFDVSWLTYKPKPIKKRQTPSLHYVSMHNSFTFSPYQQYEELLSTH